MKFKSKNFYALIVFIFSGVLFVNTIPNEYNLDDELVTINHRTTSKGLKNIDEIFTGFYYEDDMGYKYDYRPITHLSFALEHQLFGQNPHVSHAVNVVLYAFLCLLIFYLSNKIYPDKSPSFGFFVAMFFAVMPIHTEVVASIKNRDEILSLLFGLSAFYLFFFRDRSKVLIFILAIILFQLSIFSKPSTTLLLFLIPFYFLFLKQSQQLVYFLFYLLFNACVFSYFFLVSLKFQIVFPLVLILLTLFLFFIKNFKSKIMKYITPKVVQLLFISLAYFSTLFSLFYGGGLFFLIGIYLCLITLVVSYQSGKYLLVVSLLSFPVFMITSFYYNIPYFVFIYSFLFVLLNDKITNKSLILSSLFFLIVAIPIFYKFLGTVVFMFLPIIALFFKSKFKYLILLLTIINLVLNVEFIFTILANFSLVVFVVMSYFKREDFIFFKWDNYKLVFMFFFIALSFTNLYFDVESYDNLPSGDSFTKTIEKVNDLEQKNFVDVDRPLLYVENPLIENWTIEHRLKASIISVSFYLKKMMFPFPLLFYYGYDQIDILANNNFTFFSSVALLFFLLLLFMYSFFKKQFLISYAIIFLILSLIPYSNLFTPIAGIVGERLAFTASFGFSLLITLVLFLIINRLKYKVIFLSGLGFLFISLIGVDLYRNSLWKNKISLMKHDIKHLEKSANANALLAYAIMESAELENNLSKGGNEAKFYFENANSLYPSYFNWHYDLGRINFDLNELNQAVLNFNNAIALYPEYMDSYYYLYDSYIALGDIHNALEIAYNIHDLDPNNIDVLFVLSNLEYEIGNYIDVISINQKIIDIDNNIPEAYLNIAYAYCSLGDKKRCLEYVNYGKTLSPQHKDILVLNDLLSNL